MRRKLTIVNYAVNGIGAGHVTRLTALSRWLRRTTSEQNRQAEIYFLTSSEATSLLFAEGFAAFKLPSGTVIEEAGLDRQSFDHIAGAWVSQTLGLLRPDLLIVDTFPQGYFAELSPMPDVCRRKAFIYRPLKESHARAPEFQHALSNYDLIIVPEYEEHARVLIPEELRGRTQYVGPILIRGRDEVLPRMEARRLLGITPGDFTVYLTAGGGGDARAEQQLHAVYNALSGVAGLKLVIGAGPLYRGRRIYHQAVIWLTQENAAQLMGAFDLAISAAGYNSYNELMHFGVPTIFMPQQKWADDQLERARRAARTGAATVLDSGWDALSLRQLIEGWRDEAVLSAASHAARTLVPRSHSAEVAGLLLRLLEQRPEEESGTH